MVAQVKSTRSISIEMCHQWGIKATRPVVLSGPQEKILDDGVVKKIIGLWHDASKKRLAAKNYEEDLYAGEYGILEESGFNKMARLKEIAESADRLYQQVLAENSLSLEAIIPRVI